MADDKRIMKRRHENAWDTVHFTTNANHMGMDSSDMTESVNKKLAEIMTAQQVEVKPVLEDKIDVINLVTKEVLVTGTPSSTAEFEVGKTETVAYKDYLLGGAPLLFKFYGKNLDKIQDKTDECGVKIKDDSSDMGSPRDLTAVTKDNLAQMRSKYRDTMIDIGDYIYDDDSVMEKSEGFTSIRLQRKFAVPTTVGTQEKEVIYSKAIKFTAPQIIVQCCSENLDVLIDLGFDADSSKVVEIPHGTKRLKCYMRVNGSDPVSDKHILKLEMYNPFTHTVGNAVAAIKLATDDTHDDSLLGTSTKFRPYDEIEFSSEVSTVSFNMSPVDSTTVSIGFSNLDGVTVMRGIWNKAQARLEF